MNFFTTYWKNKTWDENAESLPPQQYLDHTANDHFSEKGIAPGDAVYIVTVKKGKLLVAAKIIVGQVCNTTEAARALGTSDLWNALDHIVASESTPLDWSFEVPSNITETLEFVSPTGSDNSRLFFKSSGILDQQTLRGVRRLAPESAALLDDILGPLVSLASAGSIKSLWEATSDTDESLVAEYESFADGKKNSKYVTFYERNAKNRAAALKIHGYTCKGCEINFENKYGPIGKDFIHVHHIKPVSQYEKPKNIDPATDLTVLCPNCHAMVHKKKTDTLTVERLRQLITSASVTQLAGNDVQEGRLRKYGK